MLSVRCLSVCLSCPVCLSVTFMHCGQTVGRIKTKLGMQVGLGPGHIVLDGDPAPPPQFLAHICCGIVQYCGQTAGWMKMPLGTEVDLRAGHIVLHGFPAPAKGAQHPPLLNPCLLWPRSPISATAELLRNRTISETFYILNLIAKLSPISLLYLG